MLQFANAVPLVATCNIVDTAGHDHITVVDTVIRHHEHVTNKNGLFHLTVFGVDARLDPLRAGQP
jgi:hypothetical protein